MDQVKTAASEYIASLSCVKPSDVTSPVGGGIISIIHLHDAIDATMTPDTWAVIFTAGMMGTHPTESCTGGNGNPPTEIAIVENDGGVVGGYFVDPAQSSPVIKFDEPIGVVENVVSNTPDSLTFSGVNYGPNDPQSAPSQPATVTMTVDKSGNWTVVKPPS